MQVEMKEETWTQRTRAAVVSVSKMTLYASYVFGIHWVRASLGTCVCVCVCV